MDDLKEFARKIRQGVIEVVYRQKQGHIGGPLSMADVLAFLYRKELQIDPKRPDWEERDRFVLSKGHSAIALYVAMALRGFFEYDELFTFDELHSRLQAHPDMTKLPGIDMSTGSLGQGLSAAVGMALSAKLQHKDFRVFAMIGDGESQEGQIWEAARIAQRYKLDNLIAILDHNHLQQYGWIGEDIKTRMAPENDPAAKWRAFGFDVQEINGHDFSRIKQAFFYANNEKNERPHMIIANTIKGKGISFMENQYGWHSNVPSDEQYQQAIQELAGVSNE
ncbi:transketolase [Pseudogracilibacillus auburnensis]|uniref:transketolase n=1 Tax=Pseudogracilibacillus auburnensis TaxID=1494959 RepID=UPI001A958697|nr:transketolase [Pseudogracilibacillus auburnensis]MBO1002478.1 transketolase [Pseudogracilibacillus auburnensis]